MEAFRQFAAALLVLGLLGGLWLWSRRRGTALFGVKSSAPGGGRRLQTLERLPLSPQHSLHLVRAGGRLLLVAVSPGGCSVMDAGDWNDGDSGARPPQ
jgi:flagellar biogenesis protein FliO